MIIISNLTVSLENSSSRNLEIPKNYHYDQHNCPSYRNAQRLGRFSMSFRDDTNETFASKSHPSTFLCSTYLPILIEHTTLQPPRKIYREKLTYLVSGPNSVENRIPMDIILPFAETPYRKYRYLMRLPTISYYLIFAICHTSFRETVLFGRDSINTSCEWFALQFEERSIICYPTRYLVGPRMSYSPTHRTISQRLHSQKHMINSATNFRLVNVSRPLIPHLARIYVSMADKIGSDTSYPLTEFTDLRASMRLLQAFCIRSN